MNCHLNLKRLMKKRKLSDLLSFFIMSLLSNYPALLQFKLECLGQSWAVLDSHVQSWTVMDSHVQSWTVMGYIHCQV